MDQINKALLNQLTQKIGVMKGMQMSDEEIEKSFNKSELDLIEKARGEGSKGGKIVGHTKTGKPIYGHAVGDRVKTQEWMKDQKKGTVIKHHYDKSTSSHQAKVKWDDGTISSHPHSWLDKHEEK